MNRAQLIEEIEDHHGTMHESVQDYVHDSSDEELKFFLWRLKNKWHEYDGHDLFIHLPSCRVKSVRELKEIYQAEV